MRNTVEDQKIGLKLSSSDNEKIEKAIDEVIACVVE